MNLFWYIVIGAGVAFLGLFIGGIVREDYPEADTPILNPASFLCATLGIIIYLLILILIAVT